MEAARQRDLSFGRSILGIIPKRDFRLNFKRMRRDTTCLWNCIVASLGWRIVWALMPLDQQTLLSANWNSCPLSCSYFNLFFVSFLFLRNILALPAFNGRCFRREDSLPLQKSSYARRFAYISLEMKELDSYLAPRSSFASGKLTEGFHRHHEATSSLPPPVQVQSQTFFHPFLSPVIPLNIWTKEEFW